MGIETNMPRFYKPDSGPIDLKYGPITGDGPSSITSSKKTPGQSPQKEKKVAPSEPSTIRGTESGAYDGIYTGEMPSDAVDKKRNWDLYS